MAILQLQSYSLPELVFWVGIMWTLMGIGWWPVAQVLMKLGGINSVFGHKLNFIDCALKGPVAGVISLFSFQSPEYAEKFNAENDSKE